MKEKTRVEPEHQRLVYLAKDLEDSKTLAEYSTIKNGSTIFLVLKLCSGQVALKRALPRNAPRSNEACMITGDTFKRDGVVVLVMPCGHPISQDGLMDYAWAEVSIYKRTEIRCPMCSTEWPFGVTVDYGGATPTEHKRLELQISLNSLQKGTDYNICPRCRSYCCRDDPCVSSVKCRRCSDFFFCWDCLREWKSPLPSSTCGNDGCGDSGRLAVLRDCEDKLRACPTCGTFIEFSGGCKHVQCTVCSEEFCCVCLQKRSNGIWQCSSYHSTCTLAPVQTTIPRR